MEQVQNDPKTQKNQRALERKREADRNSRRLERARTKQYIAGLEERIQLLLQRGDGSDIVQKLLAKNAQLTELVHSHEKIIASVKATLNDIPEASTASWEAAPDVGTSTGETNTSMRCSLPNATLESTMFLTNHAEKRGSRAGQIPCQGEDYGLHTHDHTGDDEQLANIMSLFPSQDLPGLATFLGSANPRSHYMIQHPSPLDKTSVYRLSAGIPSFSIDVQHAYQHDKSLGRTMEDVMQEEKITTFFGDHLPILDLTLISLYTGVRDHLSNLRPALILNELILGSNCKEYQTPVPDTRALTSSNS